MLAGVRIPSPAPVLRLLEGFTCAVYQLKSREPISKAVFAIDLFESIMVQLSNRVNASALVLIFLKALKLSNISVCLRLLAILEAASSGYTSKKNMLSDLGTNNAKKL